MTAFNIGGMTLHSCLGLRIYLGKWNVDELITRIKNSNESYERWKEIEILLIDENTEFWKF
nr:6070_t:CDS:2 [Entrophospora candida]